MRTPVAFACSALLLACSSGTGTKRATLTVAIQHHGGPGGTVTSEPPGLVCTESLCQGTFERGTVVTLTADPQTARFVRWTSPCFNTVPVSAAYMDGDTHCDVVFVAANYVFLTATPVFPHFANLEEADARCQLQSAGLPGTYRAWLSTSTLDARDRLGSARGWVRPDGLPFADSVSSLLDDHRVFFPAGMTADGVLGAAGVIYTGTEADGRVSPANCNDWQSLSLDVSVRVGDAMGGGGAWTDSGGTDCQGKGVFYCFGVDVNQPVSAPAAASGRIAFVSSSRMNGATTLDGFDAQCAAEASGAGLEGTFLAAVADVGHTMASRFDLGGAGWIRTDGIPVWMPADQFGRFPLVPIDLHADGSPSTDAHEPAWTGSAAVSLEGTAETTCSGWTSSTNDSTGSQGLVNSADRWINLGPGSCDAEAPVYCLQH